jgi:hypothetical protein
VYNPSPDKSPTVVPGGVNTKLNFLSPNIGDLNSTYTSAYESYMQSEKTPIFTSLKNNDYNYNENEISHNSTNNIPDTPQYNNISGTSTSDWLFAYSPPSPSVPVPQKPVPQTPQNTGTPKFTPSTSNISTNNTNKLIKDEYIKNKEYLNNNFENTVDNSSTFHNMNNVSTDSTNINTDNTVRFNNQLRLFSQQSSFNMPISTLPSTNHSIISQNIDTSMINKSYLDHSNDLNNSNNNDLYQKNISGGSIYNENESDKINKNLVHDFMDCEKPGSEIFKKYLENKENFNMNNSVSTDRDIARTSMNQKVVPQAQTLQGVKHRTPPIHVPSPKNSTNFNDVRTARTDCDNEQFFEPLPLAQTLPPPPSIYTHNPPKNKSNRCNDNEQSSIYSPSLHIPTPSTAPNHPYLKNKIINNDLKNGENFKSTKNLNIPSYDARHGSFSRK